MLTELQFNEFLIDFVYNSEVIEGLNASREDVEGAIMRSHGLGLGNQWIYQLRTHYYLARQVVIQGILNGAVHIVDIKKWHQELFLQTMNVYNAGNFRTCEVSIGGSDVQLAKPEFVYRLMCTYLDEYNDPTKYGKSVKTDRFYRKIGENHHKFERIHPFIDGNGRIGRLLMLHDNVRWDVPLKLIQYKNVEEYYKALNEGEKVFGEWFVMQRAWCESP